MSSSLAFTAATSPHPSSRHCGPPCPICRQNDYQRLDELTSDEILRAWQVNGVTLSPAGRACLNGVTTIQHLQCRDCGFQLFDPLLSGDSGFYADLQAQFPDYYPQSCPAFDRAIRYALVHNFSEVMDIGCGAGFFLDQARLAGLKTRGLDLNAKAVHDCRKRDHDVHLSTMSDFAASRPTQHPRFVTAFEVLEHVSNPAEFIRDAYELLQPGGVLAIAVPNNEGVHALCELEPHQWPPHHLTRWRLSDLIRLGNQAGLKVVESGSDERHGFHIRYFMNLQNKIEHALGRRDASSDQWFSELVCLAYRGLLMKHWGPRKGLGIFAFFQKPSA